MPIPTNFIDFVTKAASKSNTYLKLLCGIIEVESSWNPYAIHYDVDFKTYTDPVKWAKVNGLTEMTEIQTQKISWGLGQMEGAIARALGFMGNLPQLCDPELNLTYVTMLLTQLKARYPFQPDQISAYNMGHVMRDKDGKYLNQGYVDKVTKAMTNY